MVGDRVFRSIANSSVTQEDLLPPEMKAAGKNIDGAISVLMLGMDERQNSTALIGPTRSSSPISTRPMTRRT
jgi:hypothetical protein